MRHGLYHRQVVEADGTVYREFPVPRFRCRRRGRPRLPDVTFSVLPAALVPRRRWSVELMSWVVERLAVARRSVGSVLDELAAGARGCPDAVVVDGLALYRTLELFAQVYARLLAFPLAGVAVEPGGNGLRERARAGLVAVGGGGGTRASPVILAFHRRYFPHLLFDLRRSGR